MRKIVSHFEKDVAAVTPSMKIVEPKGVLRRIQSIEFIIGIMLRRVFADVGSQHVTPGPFTMYKRSFFVEHGYYREAHMTEDIEVALRIQSKHFLIENATDAYVYTHGPSTWKGLYSQRLRWYNGFLSNIWDYRHLFSRSHGNLGLFILPMSFISLFLLSAVLAYTVLRGLTNAIQSAYEYWLIGFDFWTMLKWNFDSFFINTSPVALLGIFTFILSIIVMIVARHFSSEKKLFYSYLLFVIFYSWFYVFGGLLLCFTKYFVGVFIGGIKVRLVVEYECS